MIDVEPWCYQNTENITTNGQYITAAEGDRNQIPAKEFHTILANINMNVLLLDIPLYVGNCIPKIIVLKWCHTRYPRH